MTATATATNDRPFNPEAAWKARRLAEATSFHVEPTDESHIRAVTVTTLDEARVLARQTILENPSITEMEIWDGYMLDAGRDVDPEWDVLERIPAEPIFAELHASAAIGDRLRELAVSQPRAIAAALGATSSPELAALLREVLAGDEVSR